MSQTRINELIQKNYIFITAESKRICGMNPPFTVAYDIQNQYACVQHLYTASTPTLPAKYKTLL